MLICKNGDEAEEYTFCLSRLEKENKKSEAELRQLIKNSNNK
jgi:hypothetical protein